MKTQHSQKQTNKQIKFKWNSAATSLFISLFLSGVQIPHLGLWQPFFSHKGKAKKFYKYVKYLSLHLLSVEEKNLFRLTLVEFSITHGKSFRNNRNTISKALRIYTEQSTRASKSVVTSEKAVQSGKISGPFPISSSLHLCMLSVKVFFTLLYYLSL